MNWIDEINGKLTNSINIFWWIDKLNEFITKMVLFDHESNEIWTTIFFLLLEIEAYRTVVKVKIFFNYLLFIFMFGHSESWNDHVPPHKVTTSDYKQSFLQILSVNYCMFKLHPFKKKTRRMLCFFNLVRKYIKHYNINHH